MIVRTNGFRRYDPDHGLWPIDDMWTAALGNRTIRCTQVFDVGEASEAEAKGKGRRR
jgi:hypothetical protein